MLQQPLQVEVPLPQKRLHAKAVRHELERGQRFPRPLRLPQNRALRCKAISPFRLPNRGPTLVEPPTFAQVLTNNSRKRFSGPTLVEARTVIQNIQNITLAFRSRDRKPPIARSTTSLRDGPGPTVVEARLLNLNTMDPFPTSTLALATPMVMAETR